MLGRLGLLACAVFALASCDGGSSREIRATGSSTVYPFTKAVAEAFVQAKSGRKEPAIESTGTGAGISRFCEGVGYQYPDNASRRMKRAEFNKCEAKGVGEILEIPIGLDGIVLAESNAGPKLQLSRKDIYLALAANPMGKPNTAKTWKDVNPALPAIPIQVLGPPSTSGTRDAFVELMLEPGCLEAMPAAQELKKAADPALLDNACHRVRSDGPYVEKGEDDNLIVQGLEQNPNALGLFGYSYLEENASRLHGVPIDGIAPVYDTIASGKYPGVRSLYLYIKKQHLKAVPGLQDFLNLYTTMWAPGGPLARHGLIAAPQRIRERSAEAIQLALPLDVSALP
ncbi:substrate-binding domain-containing protein [Sphingomonas sp. dw_22]|uniref:substrate-binding domain-containing protein n=1 Tax=Sphingomonas sp. dw_22 TaxID=2721175 RepID=UPI001BD367E7|nr:substrate-binding domain-containing protein [Sphingomonas sp. dw_22]